MLFVDSCFPFYVQSLARQFILWTYVWFLYSMPYMIVFWLYFIFNPPASRVLCLGLNPKHDGDYLATEMNCALWAFRTGQLHKDALFKLKAVRFSLWHWFGWVSIYFMDTSIKACHNTPAASQRSSILLLINSHALAKQKCKNVHISLIWIFHISIHICITSAE